MRSVAEMSLRRPVTTVMLFVSMLAIGLIAAIRLPLEALPDVSAPFLYVQFPYANATPAEIERNVLRPAEEALATMSGIQMMFGEVDANGAGVFLQFSDWNRDIAITAVEARERIDAIRGDLPDDLRRYYVMKFSTTDEPVLRVRLAGDTNLSSQYDLIDRQLRRRLERVPGVARVDISGAPASEVEIAVMPDRLSAHGLDLNTLATRLQSVNFSVSAGLIEDGGQRLRVQPIGEVGDLQELRDLPLDASGVRLGDVARVELKPQYMDYGRRLDGRAAVGLEVFKERDANLVEVSRAVLREIEAAQDAPGLSGIDMRVMQNQGEEVTKSLTELAEAGLIGLVLSIIVLYFFLRHWPSTLMVTLAIPICFVITLGLMYFFDVTLNILTLMGLLLAVGMLVDNAVVVVESIYQERERHPDQPWLASIVGTRNVAIALSAGTLCHCIVFLPNLFAEANMITIFMSQLAITISVSLLASWFVAVSLIPMMSARIRTPPAVARPDGMIPRLQRGYARLLRWTLLHRGWTVAGMLGVFLASLVPMTQVDWDLLGGGEAGREISIFYQWQGSYTKDQRSEEVARIEHFLDRNRERFGITQMYSWFGEQGNSGTLLTIADDAGELSTISDSISSELPQSARARIGIQGSGQQQGGGGSGQNIRVLLTGDSLQVLQQLAEDVVPILARRDELRDVRVDIGNTSQELTLQVNRERAAAFGFSVEDVSGFIGMALRGSQLRDYRHGDTEVPVWVRFEGAENFGAAEIAGFNVTTPDGRSVPLSAMVDAVVTPAATRMTRTNRQTTLAIQANLTEGSTLNQARVAMEESLAALAFPTGYGYSFTGSSFQQNEDAGKQMLFNVVLALLLIYVVMAAVFESLLFPSAIMSCVVFSILGVFWLFWVTGTAMTIMAMIGILVLMGVVVNNGIIMVEHINNLRRRGLNRFEALVEGSRERLRPILMTMGTAILAMIPISLSNTVVMGGLAYSPMARAVAGGLLFSTIASLLFLPTIYAMLDDMSLAFKRILRRARGGDGVQIEPEVAAEA